MPLPLDHKPPGTPGFRQASAALPSLSGLDVTTPSPSPLEMDIAVPVFHMTSLSDDDDEDATAKPPFDLSKYVHKLLIAVNALAVHMQAMGQTVDVSLTDLATNLCTFKLQLH